MSRTLFQYATPLIAGFFLISVVSGLMMFLHIAPPGFRAMHEWLGLLLIVPFGLHLWRNWRPMTSYLRHRPMFIAAVIAVLAAAPFVIASGQGAGREGPPLFRLGQAVMENTVAEVAPLVGSTEERLAATLAASGFTVTGSGQSLHDIAAASGRSEMDLAEVLVEAGT